MIRKCLPILQKTYRITKRLKTLEEVEKYFSCFLSFIDCTERQQIPRPIDNKRKTIFYSLGKKKRHTVKSQLMVNNRGYSLIRSPIRKEKGMNIYSIYKENHPVTPKQVVKMFMSLDI